MTTNDVFQPEQVYTVTEVAEWLQISNNQVTTLAKRDGWPHMKVGNRLRFTSTQLKEVAEMLNAPSPAPSEPRRKIGSRSRQSRITD
ncbi:helix-turn-helix domain-containing protein [Paenarthrobacter nicotinovorans]|uniref:helix-turn-helix domain-containing protein n=1 Tax=Paenarthrobacter nicotinovorans TaxID=29320 RepID=UPI003A808718